MGSALADVRDFFELGGGVLYLILGVTFVMWMLILERQWYYWRLAPNEIRRAIETWERRSDHSSWYAHQIRLRLISEVRQSLEGSLLMVKALVAVCPLLGLLGTVTGMIEVFDVMAISGSGNVRAMAAGVSKATIPTMAGMVAALSGLYFSISMSQLALRETERVADHLTHV